MINGILKGVFGGPHGVMEEQVGNERGRRGMNFGKHADEWDAPLSCHLQNSSTGWVKIEWNLKNSHVRCWKHWKIQCHSMNSHNPRKPAKPKTPLTASTPFTKKDKIRSLATFIFIFVQGGALVKGAGLYLLDIKVIPLTREHELGPKIMAPFHWTPFETTSASKLP